MFQGKAQSPEELIAGLPPEERYIAGYERTRSEVAGRGRRARPARAG
jgi:hypothetical protein